MKLPISNCFTEVPIEWALKQPIRRELFEKWDSEKDGRIGTVIRLALLSVLLALRIGVQDDEIWTTLIC